MSNLGSSRARCQKLPCGCGAEGFFAIFSALLFRHLFRQYEEDLFKLLFVFFSFLRFLLGFGVNATLHVCFWADGPKPSLFCYFLSFYKTLFSPLKKRGYSCSFLSVSLSSCFLFFPSLSSCFFLPCYFAVLSCLVSLLFQVAIEALGPFWESKGRPCRRMAWRLCAKKRLGCPCGIDADN